jgi:hypothetical protein
MKKSLGITLFSCITLLGGTALAGQTYSESFAAGSNVGAWTWGNAADTVHPSGGNPDEWLGNDDLDTFAPQPRTGAGVSSVFTGNYLFRRVTSVGIDLITPSTQFPFSRELTLMLDNDGGTPLDGSDDCSVYFIGTDLVPQPGEGWRAFDFDIPSQSLTLPAGWATQGTCLAPNDAWLHVIQDVTRVRFFYGNPENFFIFQVWDVGLDNPRIAEQVGFDFCSGPALPCPCGNAGQALQGCMNSTGFGAELHATGTDSASADDLCFKTITLPPGTSAILLQGSATTNTPFGDGVRCVGGTLLRLGSQTADADGKTQHGPGLAAQGGWANGQTRLFQTWYRNTLGPCGLGFNVSSAVSIAFGP